MSDVLDEAALRSALAGLPQWRVDGGTLVRQVTAPTFLEGIRLVDAVAQAAEEADHHPDIDIRWNVVTFRLVTHSVNGLTAKDVALASRIDDLAR
jgi:4a-hydroxytetrahydrobiopterin dehydratase